MKKRILALALALMMCVSLLPVTALAAEGELAASGSCGSDVTWTFADGVLTLSGKGATFGYLYNEEYAPFWCNDTITTVIIEDGVTGIGHCLFSGCTSLTSVTIPDSVTDIGIDAFHGCSSLTEVVGGDCVTSVGGSAFGGTPWLNEQAEEFIILGECLVDYNGEGGEVIVPSGVSVIGSYAFGGHQDITSVIFPDGVTTISARAFFECDTVTSVTIPDSVTTIGEQAFIACFALDTIELPSGLTDVGYEAFFGCAITSVSIPDSMTSIPDAMFSSCNELTSIEIPSSITSIGSYAFSDCTSLTDVYYDGSAAEWSAIDIKNEIDPYLGVGANDHLLNAAIHLNDGTTYEPPVVPDGTTPSAFADVAEDAWYKDTVTAAADAGIIAGNSDGTFAPNDTLSWAQAITFAVRLDQYVDGERIYGAADQTGANWYDVYVDYAIEHGIINAAASDPNADILRGDAAVIFAAVLGTVEQVNEVADGYFTDVEPGSGAQEAIYLLAQAGIANGKGGGEFGVNDTFLRCEVATIVARMAGLVEPAKLEG